MYITSCTIHNVHCMIRFTSNKFLCEETIESEGEFLFLVRHVLLKPRDTCVTWYTCHVVHISRGKRITWFR